jgi:hypothetical protein
LRSLLTANGVVHWLAAFLKQLGFVGCSSHSGARKFVDAGGVERPATGRQFHPIDGWVGGARVANVTADRA